jgi:hypothetical protein
MIAGLQFPLVEPHAHAFVAQPFGEGFTLRGVFAGVAEEDFVFEFLLGHFVSP